MRQLWVVYGFENSIISIRLPQKLLFCIIYLTPKGLNRTQEDINLARLRLYRNISDAYPKCLNVGVSPARLR